MLANFFGCKTVIFKRSFEDLFMIFISKVSPIYSIDVQLLFIGLIMPFGMRVCMSVFRCYERQYLIIKAVLRNTLTNKVFVL